MRKGTVVNLKGYRFFEFVAKNNILLILVFFFIVGVFSGTYCVKNVQFIQKYSESYLQHFISDRTDSAYFTIVAGSLSSSFLIILISFISGASMFGVILSPLIVAFRGFLYGSVNSVLYSSYSVKGIAFNAIIIIPSAIVFVISLILASRESMKFSLLTAKMTLPKTLPANLYPDFKNYCGKYMFICIIVLISSLIDGVLSCSFMSYFNF